MIPLTTLGVLLYKFKALSKPILTGSIIKRLIIKQYFSTRIN
ncbi:hypothetical protein [Pieris rapae granulovirus]|nr:hypothetical protein [Pieris rapae granulovirus]